MSNLRRVLRRNRDSLQSPYRRPAGTGDTNRRLHGLRRLRGPVPDSSDQHTVNGLLRLEPIFHQRRCVDLWHVALVAVVA
jgi:hypothetical protein